MIVVILTEQTSLGVLEARLGPRKTLRLMPEPEKRLPARTVGSAGLRVHAGHCAVEAAFERRYRAWASAAAYYPRWRTLRTQMILH